MQQERLKFRSNLSVKFAKWAALVILVAGCTASSSMAQKAGQKKFATAQDAADALLAAAQANDESALLAIFGPNGKQVVSSGDATEDADSRANFVKRYNEMHRLAKEPDGTTTLYVGSQNWPLPIPLVNKGNSWYFDTEAGKREILFRRVGRNEMSTIHVCLELVAAQKEYYSSHGSAYAGKLFSDEGQQNGLYWKVSEGQPQSPIGPLVASAVAEGYAPGQNSASPTPYRGYFYHILTGQGAAASGGAKSYVVDGKMTGGFAFIAYPAEYRSSGVMTFIVGEDGVVYSKDLGKNTASVAKAMKDYNPDSKWKKEVPEGLNTAQTN
jgi:hypothetical protein